MKKLFALPVLLSVIEITAFAQANKSLSNLTNPTSVNQSLIPSSAGSKDLGSSSKGWKDFYLSGAIYLNGGKFINNPVSGGNNTAVGWQVLNSITTGQYNSGVGYHAMYNLTTGFDNTAMGWESGLTTEDGFANTSLGVSSLYANASGFQNTAIGVTALFENNGNNNTAIGYRTLYLNFDGNDNSSLGFEALFADTSGSSNVACGEFAGYNITSGSNNSFMGYNANSGSVGAGNNMTAIGNGATVTASNHVVIGNFSVTSIGGFANWTNLSDGRVKKNIKENVPGLAFINKLQPITYNLDLDAADKIIDRPATKDKDGNIIQPSQQELDARKAKEQIVYTGFIAQDVEKAAQSLNYDFSGVDKPGNANTLYGLRYSDFVVPLVKAVQELASQNEELKTEVNDLKASIANKSSGNDRFAKPSLEGSAQITLLGQNVPNPFDNSTLIPFRIPADCHDASIMITNTSTSEVISVIPIACNEDHVSIDAGILASGTYSYTLFVDGKAIDTKTMILSK